MSVFTVTTQPVQIYDGSQGAVSIMNQGAATVYLNSLSSAYDGWPVFPGSVARWDRNTALWASTKFGECRLNVNPVSMITDQVITSAQRLLLTYANPTPTASFTLDKFECAQYNMVLIRGFSLTATTIYVSCAFSWFDENQNLLSIEPVSMTRFDPGIFQVNVPAKGSYCQVVISDASGSGILFSLDTLTIYGSTRTGIVTTENSTVANFQSGSGSIVHSLGNVFVNATDSVLVNLPSWGRVVDIACTTVGPGGTISLIDNLDSVTYGQVVIPANSSANGTVYIPSARPILGSIGMGVSAFIHASFSWRDYV